MQLELLPRISQAKSEGLGVVTPETQPGGVLQCISFVPDHHES